MSYNQDALNCKYVFANPVTSPLTTAASIVVPLPNGLERAPNVMVTLEACKLLTDTETSALVVKMEEAPFNYYSGMPIIIFKRCCRGFEISSVRKAICPDRTSIW